MLDCLIVGAGISGLYAARELCKKHPTWSIALAERYKGLGGRTYSYSHGKIMWEMGAGRIHKSHKHTLDLLKEYGLTWIPIGESICYKESGSTPAVENDFESLSKIYIQPLENLSADVLQESTIERLMISLYGKSVTDSVLSKFPYRGEVMTLRADLALKSFFGGEMSSQKGYGVVKEGFSELIARMRAEVEKLGCVILPHHRLHFFKKSVDKKHFLEKSVDKNNDSYECTFIKDSKEITIETKRLVLALHKDAVAELTPFRGWSVLKHLKTQPLLRIYGIFKKPWFASIKRTVTPGPLRYIIPVGKAIMLSYTDADDTKAYSGSDAEKKVMKDIRELFPEISIPDPTFFKAHYWDTGATYWLPGSYSPEALSLEAIRPFKNVWLCGESWSMRQAWVEGALEHTILCLKEIE